MTVTLKLSFSEIHRVLESLNYTIQMRDESDGPALKGLKQLRKELVCIKKSMDDLYRNKILDGEQVPSTVVPPPNCEVCDD